MVNKNNSIVVISTKPPVRNYIQIFVKSKISECKHVKSQVKENCGSGKIVIQTRMNLNHRH